MLDRGRGGIVLLVLESIAAAGKMCGRSAWVGKAQVLQDNGWVAEASHWIAAFLGSPFPIRAAAHGHAGDGRQSQSGRGWLRSKVFAVLKGHICYFSDEWVQWYSLSSWFVCCEDKSGSIEMLSWGEKRYKILFKDKVGKNYRWRIFWSIIPVSALNCTDGQSLKLGCLFSPNKIV